MSKEKKRIEKDKTTDKLIAQNVFNMILSNCYVWHANLTLNFCQLKEENWISLYQSGLFSLQVPKIQIKHA